MTDQFCIVGVLVLLLFVILFLTPTRQEPTTEAPEPDETNDGTVEWSRRAMARRQMAKEGPVYGGTDLPESRLIQNEDGDLRVEYRGKDTGEAGHSHKEF